MHFALQIQRVKGIPLFCRFVLRDANSFPWPWQIDWPRFPSGAPLQSSAKKNIFETLAQGKRNGGMKIWFKKLIGNRSPLMGIVLSVILSLSWGLVITLFWGK
jgi:hypothetical protein